MDRASCLQSTQFNCQNNMKKFFLSLILFTCLLSQAFSQDYIQAVGIRLGASGGLTYRRMVGMDLAGEVMLTSQNHGTMLTLLIEKHKPALLFDDLNLDFFYGAGAHVGIADRYYFDDYDEPQYGRGRYSVPQLGIDAYASFEYTLPRYPIVVNLDCKPYLEFFDDHFLGLHLPVMAIGAKYIF